LVLRPEPLTGFEHLAAAALAVGVADQLDALADTSTDPDAACVRQAAVKARAAAYGHDWSAWQDTAARHDLAAALAEVIA
jgi:hypothetical protein